MRDGALTRDFVDGCWPKLDSMPRYGVLSTIFVGLGDLIRLMIIFLESQELLWDPEASPSRGVLCLFLMVSASGTRPKTGSCRVSELSAFGLP